MKKTLGFTILSILMSLAFVVRADAATPTPTLSAQPSKAEIQQKLNDQINQLKEKIASRVSELNLVEKRGIIGSVTDVSGSKITIKDVQGNVSFVDVDEITKFYSASNNSFGLSDITKGTNISILGLYNKESKRILGRFIDISVDPVFLSGSISDIDDKNYFLTVTTQDQKQIKLDIQTTTKIFGYDKDTGLVRAGFSKLTIGERIAVVGYPSKKDPSTIVPNRVLSFATLPKNPKINVSQPTQTPTPTTKSTK